MKKIFSLGVFSICIFLFCTISSAQHVTDLAGLIEGSAVKQLEDDLQAFELKYQANVVVYTVVSLNGQSVESYARELFNTTLGVSQGRKNGGVLLLRSLNPKKVRIELDEGLHRAIFSNSDAEYIIQRIMRPKFEAGKVSDGLVAGAYAITTHIAEGLQRLNAPPPPPKTAEQIAAEQKAQAEQLVREEREHAENMHTLKIVFVWLCIVGVIILIVIWLKSVFATRDYNRDLTEELENSTKRLKTDYFQAKDFFDRLKANTPKAIWEKLDEKFSKIDLFEVQNKLNEACLNSESLFSVDSVSAKLQEYQKYLKNISKTVTEVLGLPSLLDNSKKQSFVDSQAFTDLFKQVGRISNNKFVSELLRSELPKLNDIHQALALAIVKSESGNNWFELSKEISKNLENLRSVNSQIHSAISKGEEAERESPKLIAELKEKIEKLEGELDSSDSDTKREYLEKARNQYNQAVSMRSNSGFPTMDWIILYSLLSNSNASYEKAANYEKSSYSSHPNNNCSSPSPSFSFDSGPGSGFSSGSGATGDF